MTRRTTTRRRTESGPSRCGWSDKRYRRTILCFLFRSRPARCPESISGLAAATKTRVTPATIGADRKMFAAVVHAPRRTPAEDSPHGHSDIASGNGRRAHSPPAAPLPPSSVWDFRCHACGYICTQARGKPCLRPKVRPLEPGGSRAGIGPEASVAPPAGRPQNFLNSSRLQSGPWPPPQKPRSDAHCRRKLRRPPGPVSVEDEG